MEVVVAFAAGVTVGAGALVLFGVPDRRIGPARDRGGAWLGGPAGRPRRSGGRRGEGLAAVHRGHRGRGAVVHQGPRVGSAGRGPVVPRLPVHPAARHRRHPARGVAHPGRRAPGARRGHGGAGRGGGARRPAGDQERRWVCAAGDGARGRQFPRPDPGASASATRCSGSCGHRWTGCTGRGSRTGRCGPPTSWSTVPARPWIVDFSFSELGATQRQMALDIAELLASLATIAGADRAVASAAAVIGPDGVAAAVPLLQPLALSVGTRRAIARHDGLLTADPGGRRRGERPGGPGTGPHPARPPENTAGDRRCRGRVLLPASQAGTGGKRLAGRPVGRLDVAAAGHRPVGRDLPGQRGRTHGRGAAANPALADRAGSGRIVVCQPRLPGQRRRHGAERQVPAEIRGGGQRGRCRGRGRTAWQVPSSI